MLSFLDNLDPWGYIWFLAVFVIGCLFLLGVVIMAGQEIKRNLWIRKNGVVVDWVPVTVLVVLAIWILGVLVYVC